MSTLTSDPGLLYGIYPGTRMNFHARQETGFSTSVGTFPSWKRQPEDRLKTAKAAPKTTLKTLSE